jgi:predicted nucleic acid-binding protein
VILVDSSAWIEYLRGTESATNVRVRALELTPQLAMTDVVVMELRAGARSDRERAQLRTFISSFDFLAVAGVQDFEHAADLYRACRRNGETVRKMTDCLIAAVAIRNDVPVLHHDIDFDVLARHTPLRVA